MSKYFDIDGNPIVLLELIKKEPSWAHSRIKAGEEAEAENEKLRERVAELEQYEPKSEMVSIKEMLGRDK